MPIEFNNFFQPINSIHITSNFSPSNFNVNVKHNQNYFSFSFLPPHEPKLSNFVGALQNLLKVFHSVKNVKKQLFVQNGYPKSFGDRCVGSFMEAPAQNDNRPKFI